MKFFSDPDRIYSCRQLIKAPFCFLVTLAVTLFVLWSPLSVRVQGLLDPYSFNGDALQHIAPIWFVHTAPELVQDYTLRYYLQAILPPLFKAIYATATLSLSPAAASKLLTVVLSVLFICTSAATARRLGGWVAGSLAFFLATGGVVKNLYFMGGIQRSFGFYIATLALYLACCGRAVPLAVLGVTAAMLYPAAAVCILAVLGLLSVLPAAYRGSMQGWRLSQRFALLALTTALIAIAVTPQILGGQLYGPRLSIDAASQFEEWGPHGRYTPGDRGVPVNLARKILSGTVSALSATRPSKGNRAGSESAMEYRATLTIVLSLIGGALIAISRRRALSAETIRCTVFFLGTVVAFLVATALFPLLYIPSRYIALGITALIPAVFPALWSSIAHSLTQRISVRLGSPAALILGAVIITSLGWLHVAPKNLPTASGNRKIFAFIRGLPDDVVIASWPRGIANMVPLFTARPTLMFEEGHQIFHRQFLDEMRRRCRALIATYAATDLAPIRELNTTYNVSHLLLNRRHLRKTPDYFAPFGQEMKAAREKIGLTPLILTELVQTRSVFSDKDYVIIDIRGL